MKKIVIILQLMAFYAIGQSKEQSKELLDKVNQNMNSYENISLQFRYLLENKEENINQEIEGNIVISKQKYKLKFMGIEQISNSKNIYTIVHENEEITINDVGEEEDIGLTNPIDFLNLYKKDYDYQWDIKQKIAKTLTLQYIKLIPLEKNEEIEYILIGVDPKERLLYRIIQIATNKTQTTLFLTYKNKNQKLSEDYFELKKEKYPEYYINN